MEAPSNQFDPSAQIRGKRPASGSGAFELVRALVADSMSAAAAAWLAVPDPCLCAPIFIAVSNDRGSAHLRGMARLLLEHLKSEIDDPDRRVSDAECPEYRRG
jgi:hypothetical protein